MKTEFQRANNNIFWSFISVLSRLMAGFAIKKMGFSILLGWDISKAFGVSVLFVIIMFFLRENELYYVFPLAVLLMFLSVLFVLNAEDRNYVLTMVYARFIKY